MKNSNILLLLVFTTAIAGCGLFQLSMAEDIERLELKNPETNLRYPLIIGLPKSYTKNENKSYPVIYLTDAWKAFKIVSDATRVLVNSGEMEEAIIVGIYNSKGSRGQSSRYRDFTPSVNSKFKLETGKAQNYMSFFEKTVLPHMQRNYRVDNTRRTFVGNSLGGLFGAYVLFKNPDMFNNYILGSPSVWFDNEVILSFDETISTEQKKIFIAVGELETPRSGNTPSDMIAGAKLLKDKIETSEHMNFRVEFLVIDGAKHETAFPTTAMQGLRWVMSKY